MINQNPSFFQKFSQNSQKLLKIHKILPFLDKINPYKENRVSESNGELLDKKWVVWYRAFVPWAVDVHINGLFLNFVAWLLLGQSLGYLYLVADGLALWLIPKVLTLLITPFKDSVREIVRDLPRK